MTDRTLWIRRIRCLPFRMAALNLIMLTLVIRNNPESRSLRILILQIASGETIGILGGTGSAKSSLVNLVSRLYDVTEGSVRVGGVDVRNYGVEALRNQVAVVLQNNVLFSGTILDNLRWGDPEATEEEV